MIFARAKVAASAETITVRLRLSAIPIDRGLTAPVRFRRGPHGTSGTLFLWSRPKLATGSSTRGSTPNRAQGNEPPKVGELLPFSPHSIAGESSPAKGAESGAPSGPFRLTPHGQNNRSKPGRSLGGSRGFTGYQPYCCSQRWQRRNIHRSPTSASVTQVVQAAQRLSVRN